MTFDGRGYWPRVPVAGAFLATWVTVTLAAPGGLRAQGVSWSVSNARVVVVCPLTVGGSFQAQTTALTGELWSSAMQAHLVDGDLSVDLRTLDTGIGLRNTHMREKYLQVDAQPDYGRANLSAIRSNVLPADANHEDGPFTARLTLRGVTREITGDVRLERRGPNLQVNASFPLRLAEFEIPEPRYLGVGVRNEVTIRVTFTAVPTVAKD